MLAHLPAGHDEHVVEPPVEASPALHGCGELAVFMHEWPAGQVTQYAQLESEYLD